MSGNSQKTPIQQSLHRLVDTKVQDWLSRLAKSMPATVKKVSGALVEVTIDGDWSPFAIPTITVPVAGSKYVREPLPVGTKGFVVGVDYYLGGQSGEGGGSANLVPRANLTNSVFQPITSKSFPVVDPDTTIITGGSNGAKIQSDDAAKSHVEVTQTDVSVSAKAKVSVTSTTDINLAAGQAAALSATTTLTLSVGSNKIVIGAGGIEIDGPITINGTTTFAGNMQVTGTLHSTGAMSTDAGITAHDAIASTAGNVSGHDLLASNTVQAASDVLIGSGVTLATHVHGVTTAPGFTGVGVG